VAIAIQEAGGQVIRAGAEKQGVRVEK